MVALVLASAACGPSAEQVTRAVSEAEVDGSSTPSGRIVFVSNATETGRNLDIFAMDADGSAQVRLTNNIGHDHQPAWSPDGSYVAFASGEKGSEMKSIWLMKADGSGPKPLSTGGWLHVGVPRWSPDGDQIAVAGDRGDGTQIYLVDVATGDLTKITDEPDPTDVGGAYQPDWSPDGRRILHTRVRYDDDQKRSSQLFVMNSDGTDVRLIASGATTDSEPRWSPDGRKVAFVTGRDGATEIYVMNIDGTNLTRVTDHPGDDFTPSWSPNGTHLAFASDRNGGTEIYVANSDGGNVARVTDVPEDATNPDWTASEPDDASTSEESKEDKAPIYVGFEPHSRVEDGATVMPITFLDGSRAEVVAPPELDLKNATASLYTSGGLGGVDRTIDFRYGDGSTFMHEGPLEKYEGRDGSQVELWHPAPEWDAECPNLVFRFGDWFVGVRTCQDELSQDERKSWARLLNGEVTDGGFLVLSSAHPLQLQETGGHEGPQLYLGMEERFNWVQLSPGTCNPKTYATDGDVKTMRDGTQVTFNRLQDGNSKIQNDWFVTWCEDRLMRVQVEYASEDFARAAAEGLRLRDIVLAD